MKAMRTIVAAILALALSPSMPAYASESISTEAAESTSSDNVTRIVRVGWYDEESIESGDEANEIAYERDYLTALAEYTGWRYEFVPGTWNENINQLNSHEVDLLCTVTKTDERIGSMSFSANPMGNETVYLVSRNGTSLRFDDPQTMNGAVIGCEDGNRAFDGFSTYAASKGASVSERAYPSSEQAYDALAAGEVDAVVQTSFYNVPEGYAVLGQCAAEPVYFATWSGNQSLIDELDEAMGKLLGYVPGFNSDLFEHHFKNNLAESVAFTQAELDYLATKPVVTVYYEKSWEPIEYESNGEAAGIIPEILCAIGDDTGIQFAFVANDSSESAFSNAEKAVGDTVKAVSYDYSWGREHDLEVTQPISTNSVMRVTSGTLASEPKTVALVADDYINKMIRAEFPDLEVLEYNSFGECLKAVASKQVDCTFVNSYQATYFASVEAFADLDYRSDIKITQGLALGTTNSSNPLLFDIVSKSLQRLSSNTVQGIIDKNSIYIGPRTFLETVRHYPIQTATVAALLLLMAGVTIVLAATSRMRRQRNAQLQAANNAKSDFLARMSHDIRTPMNAILGYTTLAREQVDDKQAMERYLVRISDSGEYLLALLNDILDMSKIESHKLQLRLEPFSVRECIDKVQSVFSTQIQQKHLSLVLMEDSACIESILVDRLRFQQIFMNLISNAIKFTPEGGTISVSAKRVKSEDGFLTMQYSVSDNGCGMSPEFVEKALSPFTQEERVGKDIGSGLGLSIVKSLVELMGGTLQVESAEGEGSTFSFELTNQLAAGNGTANYSEDDEEDVDLEGLHVLVVDDQPMNLEIASSLLQRKGCIVETATDGSRGVSAFTDSAVGDFDIILMDVRMPVVTGLEAARAIRALDRPDAMSIPIVALSANAYDDDVSASLEAGMNDHIAKPFDVDMLYRAIFRLVHKA